MATVSADGLTKDKNTIEKLVNLKTSFQTSLGILQGLPDCSSPARAAIALDCVHKELGGFRSQSLGHLVNQSPHSLQGDKHD